MVIDNNITVPAKLNLWLTARTRGVPVRSSRLNARLGLSPSQSGFKSACLLSSNDSFLGQGEHHAPLIDDCDGAIL